MTDHPAPQAAIRTIAGLLEARTGQQISPARAWRIEAAVRPLMRKLGLASTDALATRLAAGSDPWLETTVVEALLNNETSFFRDIAAFDMINGPGLDRLRHGCLRTRHLRIWSAGCSTGQEAYSLAMLFADSPERWAGWRIDIVGTDVSLSAVNRARSGFFSQFEIQRGLPVRTMLRWFAQDETGWAVDPALRRAVKFHQHNLFNPPPGQFDLILCRNVLMYFSPAARGVVLGAFARALDTGGLLMLGAGETVIGLSDEFAIDRDLRGFYARLSDLQPTRRMARAG